jgi:hypothetical protein
MGWSKSVRALGRVRSQPVRVHALRTSGRAHPHPHTSRTPALPHCYPGASRTQRRQAQRTRPTAMIAAAARSS